MNILITNDDGYKAPGLAAAYEAVRKLGSVSVVAPTSERSACSHMITLRRPITVERLNHPPFGKIYAVDGTPADCVRLAFTELVPSRIDLVVSGINSGANAGVDTFYSGTIAGAREGAILGIPAIALSQALRRDVEIDWPTASAVAGQIVGNLIEQALPERAIWNVNLPAPIPPNPMDHIHRVSVATHPMPMRFKRTEREDGRILEFEYGASYWARDESGPNDYSVIRDGGISITAVPLVGELK